MLLQDWGVDPVYIREKWSQRLLHLMLEGRNKLIEAENARIQASRPKTETQGRDLLAGI